MQQFFLYDINRNYNLRCNKTNKPTILYLVVRLNKRQIKLSTNVKVYPKQWNKKKQKAIISPNFSDLDNNNNFIVNQKINELNLCFANFIDYICAHIDEISQIEFILKKFIYKDNDMSNIKEKNFSAVMLLKQAFKMQYGVSVETSTKELNGTQRIMAGLLKGYLKYIQENKIKDTIKGVLTQDAIDDYKGYLLKKGEIGGQQINQRCRIIKMLINEKIVKAKEFREYKIGQVYYDKIQDKRTLDDSEKTPLSIDEIKKIKDVELYDAEKEYRDLFLIQTFCGQRISDLKILMSKQYDKETDEAYIIETKKGKTKAIILKTPELLDVMNSYKDGFEYIDFKKYTESSLTAKCNLNLKAIAKKAGLDRIIIYKKEKGEKLVGKKNKLYELISTHYARHTFITRKVAEGFSIEKLCHLTGHRDDKMIKAVYTHITTDENAKILFEEHKRVYNIQNRVEGNTNSNDTNKQQETILVLNNVLNSVNSDNKRLRSETDSLKQQSESIIDDNKKLKEETNILKKDNENAIEKYNQSKDISELFQQRNDVLERVYQSNISDSAEIIDMLNNVSNINEIETLKNILKERKVIDDLQNDCDDDLI